MSKSEQKIVFLKSAKEDGSDPYVDLFQQNGFTACCIPVLSFDFIHLQELYTALQQPEKYSGIIFTSQRAVDSVERAIMKSGNKEEWDEKLCSGWKHIPAYVVGKATAGAAGRLGFTCRGEDSGSSEALVPLIKKDISEKNSPLLFPCGNLRKETIPQSLEAEGVELHSITVYKTVVDTDFETKLKQHLEKQGVPDFLVFYSPSGIQFCKPVLQTLNISDKNTKFVAIGPTTREGIIKEGYSVSVVADKPTPESLLHSVMEVRDEFF